MIKYIIKLLVFDFGYSIVMGLILLIPSILLVLIFKEKDGKPNPFSLIISGILGSVLILGQAFIISRATEISLSLDPSRTSFIWYSIGFIFSTPIAVTKGIKDNPYNWIGIPLAYVFYLIGIFSTFDNIELLIPIAEFLSVD